MSKAKLAIANEPLTGADITGQNEPKVDNTAEINKRKVMVWDLSERFAQQQQAAQETANEMQRLNAEIVELRARG